MDIKDFSPEQRRRMTFDAPHAKAEPLGPPKPRAKYGNVKVVIDGHTFDSKREGNHYLTLKARLAAGEIRDLRLQVPKQLYAAIIGKHGECLGMIEVARYIADFSYVTVDDGEEHIIDAKGKRTAIYALKAKWLNLQSGIAIEEV